MSVINAASWIERHRRIAAELRSGRDVPAHEIKAVLREGWDYYSPDGPRATEPLGMPRYSHIGILGQLPDIGSLGKPMFTIRMNELEIESAIYRQSRIRPEPMEPQTPGSDDPFQTLADKDYVSARAWIFQVIFGHTPRDIALFLAHMLEIRPEIGKLLISKAFDQALEAEPGLLDQVGWPDSVRNSWKKTGGKDYLPPFLCLRGYAELARLAINDRGMIALSFYESGEFLTTSKLESELIPKPLEGPHMPVLYQPSPGSVLAQLVPFQTFALLPPTSVFTDKDKSRGRKWSQYSASFIPSMIFDCGAQIVDDLMSYGSYLTPENLRLNILAHPQFWPEARKGYGYSIQNRAAVMHWGLDRRQNVAVGMLEIALLAQEWNQKYSKASASLRTFATHQRLGNAMQMLCCLWLEDTNAAALGHLEEDIRRGFKDKKTGELTIFRDDMIDDICHREGFGQGLFRNASKLIKRRAKPGHEGYSARCLPHLSISPAEDDIGYYLKLQTQAVADHVTARAGLRPGSFSSFNHQSAEQWPRGCKGGPNRFSGPSERQMGGMTLDPEAAHCTRDKAMMLSSSSTDPMRSFLDRPPQKPINEADRSEK